MNNTYKNLSDLPLELSLDKCAKLSGWSVHTLRRWERDGRFPKGRRRGYRVRINTKKFFEWLGGNYK